MPDKIIGQESYKKNPDGSVEIEITVDADVEQEYNDYVDSLPDTPLTRRAKAQRR